MLQILSFLILSVSLQAAPLPQSFESKVDNLLHHDVESAVGSLRKFGTQAHASIEALAFDGRQPMEKRWKALMVLTKLAGPQSLPALDRALNNEDWFMRSAGLTALRVIDKKKSHKWAFKKLKSDPALMVRTKAFELLRGTQNTSVTELFWHKLNSRDSFHQNKSLWIRYDLAHELLQNPRQQDIKRWVNVLHDQDRRLQIMASQALSKLSGPVSPRVENQVSYWKEKYPQSQKL